MKYNIPQFIIKKNLQKTGQTLESFEDILTQDILSDICRRITNTDNYQCNFVDDEYHDDILPVGTNKGRMIILKYQEIVHFITCSEKYVKGSNSSVQSVPTALNAFYKYSNKEKKFHYYFLMEDSHNTRSPISPHILMAYRMMATIGVNFLNVDYLSNFMAARSGRQTRGATQISRIDPFVSIDDVINARNQNSKSNRGNSPSYLTKNSAGEIEIYLKTYGASKYDSIFLCYAVSKIIDKSNQVTAYEMIEGNLKKLPEPSRSIIKEIGVIKIITTNNELEYKAFNQTDKGTNFRSHIYISHLLDKFKVKRCALCGCEIPEIIQGAHIWPVAKIKEANYLSNEQRFNHATNGENGLWLCQNHHGLFDQNIITISHKGDILFSSSLSSENEAFLNSITTYKQLPEHIMTDQFIKYLDLRNDTT